MSSGAPYVCDGEFLFWYGEFCRSLELYINVFICSVKVLNINKTLKVQY